MINSKSILLLILLLGSALTVVTIRHENRIAFVELEKQEKRRDELQTQWGRLMLEKATWIMEQNIAENAGLRLGMLPPKPERIITVQLQGVDQ